MSKNENIQVIKEHFAAFGRGDVQLALEMVAEKVDWQSPVTKNQSEEISWAKPCHNKKEVMQFFQELVNKVQPEKFEIVGFTAQGDNVVVEGSNQGQVRSTGKRYEHDWLMIFTILDGKIVRHRHYYDTADIIDAFRP
ncbi:MAG: nuclear transport factor 2 family protein [Bacteroidales bacterium]|nr:nuclear transport factor 2 family protein [Bacteroidales bacterium]